MLPTRLLTPRQLADYLGYSLATVYKLTMKDEIPRVYLRGGAMRFRASEVDKWVKSQPRRRVKGNGGGEAK